MYNFLLRNPCLQLHVLLVFGSGMSLGALSVFNKLMDMLS